MAQPDLFFEWYDLLVGSKDYEKEISYVVSLLKRCGSESVSRVLEVGAGTGNHSLELGRRGFQVVGLDTDPRMLSIAESKLAVADLPNVRLQCAAVQGLQEDGFDLALALFNVINYPDSWGELTDMLEGISNRLVDDGLFIFDCWNGVAVLRDPPANKQTRVTADGFTLSSRIRAHTDLLKQRTRLEYLLELTDEKDDKRSVGRHSFTQTFWTPLQMRTALESTGFCVVDCCKLFEPDCPAAADHWKIMFTCRKRV